MTDIVYKKNSDTFPDFVNCWEITRGQNASQADIVQFVNVHRTEINSQLNKTGALLIRGFQNLTTADDFEAIITALFPSLMDYVGGTSPRHKIKGKIMEATHVPPTWSIPLHQEMAYTKTPPARIAFFCQTPAPSGGASLIGDMRKVLEQIDAKLLQKCQQHGLILRRTLPSPKTLALKPGVKKTWQEVFDCQAPEEAERIVAKKGWRVDWLQDEVMHLWQDRLPASRFHLGTQSEVWCNQAHFFSPICMMDWAARDGRTDDYLALANAKANHPHMLDMTFFGNGEAVSDEESRHIASVIQSLEVPIALQQSDVLILDNILVAHGRYAFEGQRDILVALAEQAEACLHHAA